MSIEPFYWTQPQPRIVQHQKRRYALRLEMVFWQQLERLAKKRNQRLGQLVANLAAACDTANVSSFIRGYCMVEAERENARYRLTAGNFDLVDVLRGSPSPAMLLTDDRNIIEVNPALLRWVESVPHDKLPVLTQQKFDDVFEPRIGRSLDETVALMRSGNLKRAQFQVAYNKDTAQVPRIVMATMMGLTVGSIFYLLVWLTVNTSYRITTV